MAEETIESKPTATPRPRSAWRWVWISLIVLLLFPVVAYGGFVLYVMYGVDIPDDGFDPVAVKSRAEVTKGGKKASAKSATAKSGVAKTPAEAADDRFRKDIVGTWERFDDGRRRFTINADGTAKLVYEPKGFKMKAALLTSKLTVQIEWTLKGGYVDFVSKSGDPEYAFKVAKVSEGARKRRRIVELTEEKLILTNDANDRVSNWKRIK